MHGNVGWALAHQTKSPPSTNLAKTPVFAPKSIMSNYRRLRVPGGTYFFTLCLQDRSQRTLTTYADELRQAWKDVGRRRPFETIAAVILPDHLHTVITLPEGDFDYSSRLSHLKSAFTRRLPDHAKSVGRKRERGVWQRRFWEHHIRDEHDLDVHVNYIHWNPVKHGYVSEVDDWPHSTWRNWRNTNGNELEVPPPDWNPVHIGD